MEYTSLGRTGLHVSKISYGTWQFSGEWGQIRQEQWNAGKATIRQAFALGINLFDTAQAYGFGLAERLLGEALQAELRSQRDTIVLATKGGLRMEGNRIVRDSSAGWLRQGVEESLRALGVSSIDLYQVHWPDPNVPMEETASALDELVREGKIRYVGVSNFNVEQMQAFERTRKIDTLQPPYSLFRREVEKEILPYCEAADIGVLVYGALAHGLLGGSFTSKTTFPPDDWRSQHESFSGEGFRRNIAVVERLKRVAQEQGMTIAQLAVAWVLAQPAVDVAIVGARTPQQLAQNAEASEKHLTPETLRVVEAILRDTVPIGSSAPE